MRAWWLVLIAGCKFTPGVAPAGDGHGIDTGSDVTPMDAPVQMDAFDPLCYGKAPFTVCLPAAPTGDVTLAQIDTTASGATCDGGSGTVMMVGGGPACVKAAQKWTVGGGTLGVSGALPLVLLASDTITIDGYLDASSAAAGAGPGASPVPADCATAGVDGNGNSGGGGGGAGGSFGASGGNGGKGNNGNTTAGIAAMAAMTPVGKLRAGCRGGHGGDGGSQGTGGAGGYGGGAVYLVTHGTIAITTNGVIDASGEGGKKALHSKGAAGGGGSGGMIVLYAFDTITTSAGAKIFANGGGGGGGADNNSDGMDGQSAMSATTAATGGPAGGGAASPGGNGGFGTTAAASANAAGGGGGGGGGGSVGVIRVLSGQSLGNATVSPTAGS